MLLSEADLLARRLLDLLKPHCDRIEVAGSIRRKKEDVKDIEIVCIPKEIIGPIPEFVNTVNQFKAIKGDPFGRYTQRVIQARTIEPTFRENVYINLDLFITDPLRWGLIYAIRTGSVEFSKKLASQWSRMGYKSVGGVLIKNEQKHYIKEERDLFDFLKMEWVEPEFR